MNFFFNMDRLSDLFCSGRRSCEIPIPNSKFDDFSKKSDSPAKCLSDLKSYLYAEYTCLPGKCDILH